MANICLYVCRFISLGFLIAAIAMTVIFSKTRCITTAAGLDLDCSAVAEVYYCDAIYVGSLTVTTPTASETALSCAWYPRDLGVAFTALSLSAVFLVVSTLNSCFDNVILSVGKKLTGWLGVLMLLVSIILMAADLFSKSPPVGGSISATGTTVTTNLIHLINIILIGLAFICYLILAIAETKSKKEKPTVVKVVQQNNYHNNHQGHQSHQRLNMSEHSVNTSTMNGMNGRSMMA